MLHEISSPRLKGTGQWDVPAAICGEFGTIGQGLYVFMFVNDSDEDVYDNNATPKVVVPRRGRSLRAGKFEQGLTLRLQNYNAHMHRLQADGTQRWVLQECFRSGLVLDLAGADDAIPAPARVFERYWMDAVAAFLDANRLLATGTDKQPGKGDWRVLRAERWTPDIQEELRSYLADVSARIFAMIDVGRLPLARRTSMAVPAGGLDGMGMSDDWIPEQRLA
jgi:hypothetical protein